MSTTTHRQTDPATPTGPGPSAPTGDRVSRTARPDFPLYDGTPVRLSGGGWAVLLGALAVGIACDLALPVPGPGWVGTAVRGLLLAGLPLLALHLLAPGTVRRLFRRMRPRDGLLAVGVAAVNMVVTSIVALVLSTVLGAGTSANPMNAELAHLSLGDRVLTFVAMIPQLVGEEVMTLVPFLAVLTLGVSVLHLSKRSSIVLAVVTAAVFFAAIHLPTYGWNILQCLAVIGIARVVLWVPYLVTRNLAVSATAHVVNDWALFGTALLAA
jgi:membrane protease YdiL (CAAX protease family)